MNKVFLALIVALLSVGCYSNPSTPAGHEGYVYENPRVWGKGGFQGAVDGPGNYGVSIWNNNVKNVDIRPQTRTEVFQIRTTDDLNVDLALHTVISIRPGSIRQVVETYGGDWYKNYLQETLRTFVRDTVQPYQSQAVKESRAEITGTVKVSLLSYLKETPFELVSIVVGNIDYPDKINEAVERKLAADQLLEEKETQKSIMIKDAEIKIEEARGIAEAQRIINSTLTQAYLQHEAIQAQLKMAESPNHTTVYIPSGANGIPIIKNVD